MKKSPSASLGQNAIYKGILNAFNLLVPLFVGPYIAGLLSPELYGIYNRVYAEFNVFFVDVYKRQPPGRSHHDL